MKFALALSFILVTTKIFAGSITMEEIYEALNVKEEIKPSLPSSEPYPPIGGGLTTIKKVGALTCTRHKIPGPYSAQFDCDLDSKSLKSHKDIYIALEVLEKNPTPGLVGAINLEKRIGGLICSKKGPIYFKSPEPEIKCALDKSFKSKLEIASDENEKLKKSLEEKAKAGTSSSSSLK